mgnify:CR=1 FL=1
MLRRGREGSVDVHWEVTGRKACSCQTFSEMFSQEAERTGAARHFRHEPGAKCYIDWAGDTARIVDRITGAASKVCVLVVVLPCSGRFW